MKNIDNDVILKLAARIDELEAKVAELDGLRQQHRSRMMYDDNRFNELKWRFASIDDAPQIVADSWLAMDESGEWYKYESRPEVDYGSGYWYDPTNNHNDNSKLVVVNYNQTKFVWNNSLHRLIGGVWVKV